VYDVFRNGQLNLGGLHRKLGFVLDGILDAVQQRTCLGSVHGYSEGCDADCDESASAHFGSPFDVGQEAEFHRREDGFSVLVDSESFTPTGSAFKRKQIAVM
jgi:hypothetical protein